MNRFFTLLLAASCLTAVGQAEYCLEGTVWDEALQGCVPESVACEVEFDFDEDGYVGTGDLLTFLTAFGASFPDEDADGVCDEIDECVGEYDECGVCNGPGAVHDCGCEECVEFVECGDLLSYQGYDYQTVQIGEQCWFAENLRAENYGNGDSIPTGLSDMEWENTISGAVTVYGEGSTWCATDTYVGVVDPCEDSSFSLEEFGRLYNWYCIHDNRGLCPTGWHVSTRADWSDLITFLGDLAGFKMKTLSGWYQDGNGDNSSGFSAKPAGGRDDVYTDIGEDGYWWTSTVVADTAFAFTVTYSDSVVQEFPTPISTTGFIATSIRCIKDSE